MTDREMLDHFSDVLISDPRLLSLQERELLSNLLQLTHRVNGDNTAAETIARALGETVAARMHEALGTSILQRLAAERSPSTSNRAQFPPRPPSPGSPSPGAGLNLRETRIQSSPPRPPSALRRYYRGLIRTRKIALGDDQTPRRYAAHNESVARSHHQLAGAVTAIAGEPVKPSYVYVASYQSGAELEKHTDREQCE